MSNIVGSRFEVLLERCLLARESRTPWLDLKLNEDEVKFLESRGFKPELRFESKHVFDEFWVTWSSWYRIAFN